MLRYVIKILGASLICLFFAKMAIHAGDSSFNYIYFSSSPKFQAFMAGDEGFESKFIQNEALLQTKKLNEVLADKLPSLSTNELLELSEFIVLQCYHYGFPPAFVLSVIEVESTFQPQAVSFAGAFGLMQVKADTAEPIAQKLALPWQGKRSLFNPKINIAVAIHYLAELREKYKQPRYYLSAYNYGPTRLNRIIRQGQTVPSFYYEKVKNNYYRFSQQTAL